jgi:hypothetical protein
VPSTHSEHTFSVVHDKPGSQSPPAVHGQFAAPATHARSAQTSLRQVAPAKHVEPSAHGQPSVPAAHTSHFASTQVFVQPHASFAKQPQPGSPTVQQVP